VVLHALGIVGRDLHETYPDDWVARIELLGNVNWFRTNVDVWEGRALELGKISKAVRNVRLTANYLKHILQLELNAEETKIEREFSKSRQRIIKER